MQNTIFVRNLKITGVHGASAKLAKRVFTIDMDITLKNIDQAIQNDDLKETFDYRNAVKVARDVITGEPIHLIETLVSKISKEILKHPKVQKIKLTLLKRELSENFDSGVRLEQG